MTSLHSRIRRIVSLLLLCFVTSNLQASPVVVVVGDSLSAAHEIPVEATWVHLLEKKLKTYDPKSVVINASASGDMTSDGEQRLPSLLSTYQPNVVIIELGSNDALGGKIFFIKPSLLRMVSLCQEARTQVILIGMKLPPNMGADYVTLFEKILNDVATITQISFIPFLLEGIANNDAMFLPDRMHPNEKAGPTLLNTVWPTVQAALGLPATAPATIVTSPMQGAGR